ncbi:MAG: SRPBCC domain-containing protein, partial [Aestuariivirga sp.]
MSRLAQTILPKDKPQIITTRLIAAPRELVWKVLTMPEHLQHFWGPDGFTNTYKQFDLRVGGQALYTMHGPDGTDYPNRMRFSEVIANTSMVAEHDAGKDGPDQYRFRYGIMLTDENGKTRVTISLLIADLATRDEMTKFAAEGGRQNLDRLAAYVAPMAAAKNLFEIERTFAVSQERLFQACTRA